MSFTIEEIDELFIGHDIKNFKKKLIEELKDFLSTKDYEKTLLF